MMTLVKTLVNALGDQLIPTGFLQFHYQGTTYPIYECSAAKGIRLTDEEMPNGDFVWLELVDNDSLKINGYSYSRLVANPRMTLSVVAV